VFEPLNDLERLLMAAAQDFAHRASFSQAVLQAPIFVSPLSEPDAEGRVSGLRSVTLEDGSIAAAVFTAPERATAMFGPDILFLSHDGRTLLEWLRPGPIVLNPGQDYGVVWGATDLEALLTGMTSEVVQKETKILLGHPAQRPDELIARLTNILSSDNGIQEAYLMLAHRGDSEGQTWMLGVATSGDWRHVQVLIGKAVGGFAFDKPMDVMRLEGGSLDDTLRGGIPIVAPRNSGTPALPKKRGLFNLFGKD
jgi:hypothetical protein